MSLSTSTGMGSLSNGHGQRLIVYGIGSVVAVASSRNFQSGYHTICRNG